MCTIAYSGTTSIFSFFCCTFILYVLQLLIMSLIKDIYAPAFYEQLTSALQKVVPSLDKGLFLAKIYEDRFPDKEWKQRVKHTTQVLHGFLPARFPLAADIIVQLVNLLRAEGVSGGLAYIILPDYIETYGLEELECAAAAFENITQFISCEFAVRPFIIRYGDQMITKMIQWSLHKNENVRRLATEGSRPRLPWAMAIPFLKKNPSSILPLLENLKDDPSETVRRSVANNLNDISKDNPLLIIDLVKKWSGRSMQTDALLKHGCRTLLKQGHLQILEHYGLDSEGLTVSGFRISTPEVAIGNALAFTFCIENKSTYPKTVRLEYGLYYRKANSSLSKKVFKISERTYLPGEKVNIERKQSFRQITTRVFYPGGHQLSVIINGHEGPASDFELIL